MSDPGLDELYEIARREGAVGGKITGTGRRDVCCSTVVLIENAKMRKN